MHHATAAILFSLGYQCMISLMSLLFGRFHVGAWFLFYLVSPLCLEDSATFRPAADGRGLSIQHVCNRYVFHRQCSTDDVCKTNKSSYSRTLCTHTAVKCAICGVLQPIAVRRHTLGVSRPRAVLHVFHSMITPRTRRATIVRFFVHR